MRSFLPLNTWEEYPLPMASLRLYEKCSSFFFMAEEKESPADSFQDSEAVLISFNYKVIGLIILKLMLILTLLLFTPQPSIHPQKLPTYYMLEYLSVPSIQAHLFRVSALLLL